MRIGIRRSRFFFLVRGKIAAAKTGRVKPWRRAEWVRVVAFFFPNIFTKLFFLRKESGLRLIQINCAQSISRVGVLYVHRTERDTPVWHRDFTLLALLRCAIRRFFCVARV